MDHGGPVQIPSGHAVVVPAGTPHQILGGRGVTLTGVGFCSSCLQLPESEPLMQVFRIVRRGGFPAIPIDPDRHDRIRQLLGYLEDDIASPVRNGLELHRAVILLVLGEVDRAVTAFPLGHGRSDEMVAQALRFIEEEARNGISLSDVAAAVGRTPSHVARSVKKATGYPVGRWIATRRVTEAATLLAHTDLHLDAITEHVGWSDTTHLIRQFKKYYGMTPAAWRRSRAQ